LKELEENYWSAFKLKL